MRLRLTLPITVALLLVASPADAATLNANKQCYREADDKDPVIFGGGPYSPNGTVNVTRDGIPVGTLQANPQGVISGILTRPPTIDPTKQRPFTIVATDAANPALTGTLTRLVSQLDVTVRPTGGRPAVRRRITARGFTSGPTLYAHVVRGRKVRNVRIGALSGPCGTLRARKRVFRKRTKNGTYRVQFDTSRRYASTTDPSLTFRVRIFTVFRSLTAGSATATERWVRTG